MPTPRPWDSAATTPFRRPPVMVCFSTRAREGPGDMAPSTQMVTTANQVVRVMGFLCSVGFSGGVNRPRQGGLAADHLTCLFVGVKVPALAAIGKGIAGNREIPGLHGARYRGAIGMAVYAGGSDGHGLANRQGNKAVITDLRGLAVDADNLQAGAEVDAVLVAHFFFKAMMGLQQYHVIGNIALWPGKALAGRQARAQQQCCGCSSHQWLLGVSCRLPCQSERRACTSWRSRP